MHNQDERLRQAVRIRELLQRIRQLSRDILAVYLDPYGLTVPQFMVLGELVQDPGLTLSQLASRLGMARSTISGIVDRLEAQGLLTRERDSQDRRTIHLELGKGMKDLSSKVLAIHKQYMHDLASRLSAEEIESIITALEILKEVLTSNLAQIKRES
ncbi:MAG: MarR family transcriptional regulator [Clostridia bacterium]|nr:MarR family transcriptional regulator [Clostridia bacterium]